MSLNQSNAVVIDGRTISRNHKPYIVAEMSGNHNQSLEQALSIIDSAAKAGVDAIKLQTYTADTMTIKSDQPDFIVPSDNPLWHDQTLYDLYQQAHTPWQWHEALFARAREHGISCFSSPFDKTAVDFLEQLNVPAYKIASFENIDIPLIEYVAQRGKPVILSTGMANLAELHTAVTALRDNGCNQIILLKCTSAYPAPATACNLATIPHMRDLFQCQVGLSDHTMGIGVAIASTALGTSFIEKHFTIDRAQGGVDAAFSMEPAEMSALVTESERAWQASGEILYGRGTAETSSQVFRRSLYIIADMKAGDILDETNLRVIRPGYGLAPNTIKQLLGKRINQDVPRGTALNWDLIG